jgi:hypothetical protein
VNGTWRAPARALAVLVATTACTETSKGGELRGDRPSVSVGAEAETPSSAAHDEELATLRGLEESSRQALNFADRAPWYGRSGADPVAIFRFDATRWVGLERGHDALVVLDRDARHLQRVPAPVRPTGLTRGEDGTLWVVGEGEPTIARYRVDQSGITQAGAVRVPGSFALRDVAAGPAGWVYVADRHRGRVRAVRTQGGLDLRLVEVLDVFDCAGAHRVQVLEEHLLGICMLDHRVMVARLAPDGRPVDDDRLSIEHDGPMWSLDALAHEGGFSLVVGGVEDRPLDRSNGAFGFIDSHVFAYQIERSEGSAALARRRAEINVSAHGVITPKALRLTRRDEGFLLTIGGYGGDRMLELELDEELRPRDGGRTRDVPAGVVAFDGALEAGLAANPLLDAWLTWRGSELRVVPVAHQEDDRTTEERIGEALIFTKMMAPWNESVGRQSRFTCETCHFEGTVDGRTHWTGRETVHATSKTLQGLFENRPHFSRALDRTLTQMVHNEFRVANLGSGADPWFTLSFDDAPWIRWLGVNERELDPVALRRALMAFLMGFTHDANPTTSGRTGFDDLERRGAELFAEHCEHCHQARLLTDRPESRVPFEGWQTLVFAGGPIVWAEDARRVTGVEPLVHRDGARTPSLRRLWVKRPYFTNGSAADLESVLERAVVGQEFLHFGTPGDGQRHLAGGEQRALAAFLDLL